MKKSKRERISGTEPDIPAAVMEGMQQAFQRSSSSGLSCPDIEMVIGYALEELDAAEQQIIQAHLLTCRDCLELFLDVRLARAEAESQEPERLQVTPREASQKSDWLAALGRKVQETWQALIKPRKLIPALATVSLVALVFLLGRQERSNVLPPPQLALEQEAAPMTAPSAAPAPKPAPVQPQPAAPGRGLLAAKKKFDSAAQPREKSMVPSGVIPESWAPQLDLSESLSPGGALRLAYRADRNSYGYLLRQDSSGKLSLLFSGHLESGKTYLYSVQDHTRQTGLTAGQIKFHLVALEKPVDDIEKKIRALEPGSIQQIQNLFPAAAHRSLSITLP